MLPGKLFRIELKMNNLQEFENNRKKVDKVDESLNEECGTNRNDEGKDRIARQHERIGYAPQVVSNDAHMNITET